MKIMRPEVQRPKPASEIPLLKRALNRVKKFGRAAAFSAALPLLGAISACDSCCYYPNETTININREVDGIVSPASELARPPERRTADEPLLDFVNEAQDIATERMPSDVDLTRVEEECSNDGDRSGYAVCGTSNSSGIYVINPISLGNVDLLFHEIGHLQPRGGNNEVVSQLNAYEGLLMGFVIFSNQAHAEESTLTFSSYIRSADFGLDNLLGHVTGDSPLSVYDDEEYVPDSMFILMELKDRDGDIRSLRDYVAGLSLASLEDAITNRVDDFAEHYSAFDRGAVDSEVDLDIRKLAIRELFRRFGFDAAMDFFSAMSHYTMGVITRFVTFGLDGFNCRISETETVRNESCFFDDECQEIGAQSRAVQDVTYNCFTINEDSEDEISFRNTVLTARVHAYFGDDAHTFNVDGIDWYMVDIIQEINSQTD